MIAQPNHCDAMQTAAFAVLLLIFFRAPPTINEDARMLHAVIRHEKVGECEAEEKYDLCKCGKIDFTHTWMSLRKAPKYSWKAVTPDVCWPANCLLLTRQ